MCGSGHPEQKVGRRINSGRTVRDGIQQISMTLPLARVCGVNLGGEDRKANPSLVDTNLQPVGYKSPKFPKY